MPIQVTVKNSSLIVTKKVADFADLFMATLAAQINKQILVSGRVPFYPKNYTSKSGKTKIERGALRSSIGERKNGFANYTVFAGQSPDGDSKSTAAAYAAAQEAGITRGHAMTKYSTPGTGPHWFQGAIDTVKAQANEYIQQAKDAVGLT